MTVVATGTGLVTEVLLGVEGMVLGMVKSLKKRSGLTVKKSTVVPPTSEPVSEGSDYTQARIGVLSGKKLDEAVANKIMGWTPWRSPCVPVGSEPDCWRTRSERNPTVAMWGWQPSQDYQSMAKVVEKMAREGYRLQVQQSEAGEWRAVFCGPHRRWMWALGLTMPCAVSRAALLAKEAAAESLPESVSAIPPS